jgi:hypothetical protein
VVGRRPDDVYPAAETQPPRRDSDPAIAIREFMEK